jgi:hypothetical protein
LWCHQCLWRKYFIVMSSIFVEERTSLWCHQSLWRKGLHCDVISLCGGQDFMILDGKNLWIWFHFSVEYKLKRTKTSRCRKLLRKSFRCLQLSWNKDFEILSQRSNFEKCYNDSMFCHLLNQDIQNMHVYIGRDF